MTDVKKMTPHYSGIGSPGLKRQDRYVYEEFLPELRWPRAGKIYQEMADNDPVVGSILYLAEMLIRSTTWTVKPHSDDNTEDLNNATFLQSCMDDMETSWPDMISEVLSMLTYGFSLHEIVYKVRRGPYEESKRYRSKYSDGKIGWRDMPIRAQRTLDGWVYNDRNELVAVEQQCEPDWKRVTIPMKYCMLFRTRASKTNPEGKSLLRNAYRPWYFKKHFEEIEGIGVERDLAGLPILQTPEGLDLWSDSDPKMIQLRAQAETLIRNVRRDSEEGILLPFGWKLDLLTSGSGRQIPIGSTIERYDNRIAITMLSDIVLLGTQSGSFALADTKQSMLAAALQSELNIIAEVFNQKAVPDLFQVNGIDLQGRLPKILPGKIHEPALKEMALMLRAMSLKTDVDRDVQNHLRRMMNIPEITAEEFDELYATQETTGSMEGAEQSTSTAAEPIKADTADKVLEMNDMNYVEGL